MIWDELMKIIKPYLAKFEYGSDEYKREFLKDLYKLCIKFSKNMIKVNVVNKSTNELPQYADSGSSGCDVRANLWEIKEKFLFNSEVIRKEDGCIDCVRINPGGRALIPSGLHVNLPEGYEIQVRCRSGLALKQGIMVTNGLGTIDESYTGDIGVILTNTGSEPFDVHQGDRIAQLVLMQVPKIKWNLVESLDETERGEGGFGHSGI